MGQGGPLSPLLFSLALQEVIAPLAEELKISGATSWFVWYLDDGLIFAELSVLDKILERLATELPRIGLAINKAKTIVAHSGSLEASSSLKGVNSNDLRSTDSGVKVPIGPIGYWRFAHPYTDLHPNIRDYILSLSPILCDHTPMSDQAPPAWGQQSIILLQGTQQQQEKCSSSS